MHLGFDYDGGDNTTDTVSPPTGFTLVTKLGDDSSLTIADKRARPLP